MQPPKGYHRKIFERQKNETQVVKSVEVRVDCYDERIYFIVEKEDRDAVLSCIGLKDHRRLCFDVCQVWDAISVPESWVSVNGIVNIRVALRNLKMEGFITPEFFERVTKSFPKPFSGYVDLSTEDNSCFGSTGPDSVFTSNVFLNGIIFPILTTTTTSTPRQVHFGDIPMRTEEEKIFLSSNFHSVFRQTEDEILKDLLARPLYDSDIHKPWYLDNGIDSRYPIGQVVPYSTDEYWMRKYQSVMYVVKDFGTSNPVFTREAYVHIVGVPGWSPHRSQIMGDSNRKTYPLNQEEIDEFSLKITQSSFSLKR